MKIANIPTKINVKKPLIHQLRHLMETKQTRLDYNSTVVTVVWRPALSLHSPDWSLQYIYWMHYMYYSMCMFNLALKQHTYLGSMELKATGPSLPVTFFIYV